MLQKRQTAEAGFVLIWQQGGGWVGEKGEVLARIFGFENLYKSLRFASPPGGRARTGVEAVLSPASLSSSSF